jgi:hypothetical protein
MAAQAAAAAVPVAHVAIKLPDFWVKDPKMWFSQAKAQFRRGRITVEATMYDHVLMKLPEDVFMSVRALISDIEANSVKQATSYQLIKNALLSSFAKTKWQMTYALLDHPDLGDRRPSAMMAKMLSLRFETSAPDSLFFALFLRRLPASIIHPYLEMERFGQLRILVLAVSCESKQMCKILSKSDSVPSGCWSGLCGFTLMSNAGSRFANLGILIEISPNVVTSSVANLDLGSGIRCLFDPWIRDPG